MYDVVISGTGLYTPAHSISNEELVASFNTFVQRHNAENAAAIEAGEMQPLAESSAAFIEKASGIKSRFVTDKDGILDPQRMVPRIAERSNDQWSILCEMSVKAAEQALARAGKTAADRRLLEPAARLSGDRHRGAGGAGDQGLRLRHERRLLFGDIRYPERRQQHSPGAGARGADGQSGDLHRAHELP